MIGWAAILTYVIVIGGSPLGDSLGWTRALNGLITVALIGAWLIIPGRRADRLDGAIVVAVLLFAFSALLSTYPRASLDSLLRVAGLAAAFWFLRGLPPAHRAACVTAMAWIGVVLSLVVAVAWSYTGFVWIDASGWSLLPPLDLPRPTFAFGHRHDLALLLVLLLPAIWSQSFRSNHRLLAFVATVSTGLVVVLDGSRSTMAALAVASLVILVSRDRARWLLQRRTLLVLTIAFAVGSGLLAAQTPLWTRIANMWTAVARFELWSSSMSVWLERPVAGLGPGTFPFALLQTDHFAESSFDPRHPDSAIVQLAVTTGILGLVAASAIVLAFALRVRWRDADWRPVWGIIVFAVSCLAANPSDFLFLIAPVLIWASSLAPPRHLGIGSPRPQRPPAVRLRYMAAAVVSVAVLLTSLGPIAYELARWSYGRGDRNGSMAALSFAVAVDPAQPFYGRELAALHLAAGDWDAAVREYRRTLDLSPVDPVAHRGLALALASRGDWQEAEDAARTAAGLKPLSSRSHVVLAMVRQTSSGAHDALADALLASPTLAVAPWGGTGLAHMEKQAAVRRGAQRAAAVRSEVGYQPMLLSVLTPNGDPGRVLPYTAEQFRRPSDALMRLWRCDAGDAWVAIQAAESSAREEGWYWIVRALVASNLERAEHETRLARLYHWAGDRIPQLTESLLTEGLPDTWRYRHVPLAPDEQSLVMPSPGMGLWLLTSAPGSALGMLEWPPHCSELQ